MKKVQAILLFSIVFVAGCVGQTTAGGPGGPGCVLAGPTANPSTAEPGTTILLDAIVENKGGSSCEGARVELFGYPSQIRPDATSRDLGSLFPADPSRGVKEGQREIASFTITGEGRTVDVPYDIGAKLTYTYTTTLEGTIRAVTPQRLREKNDKGGIDFKSTTGGPISLSLNAPSTVISGGKINYQIIVSNTGAGRVEGDKVTVDVQGCKSKEVNIRKGSTGVVSCPVTVPAGADFQTISVTASTRYTYVIENIVTVTILKNPVLGQAFGV